MQNRTPITLENEKRYFVRFFRLSTIGIIVTLTFFIMLFISVERWRAFSEESMKIQQEYELKEREAIKNRVLQIEQFINYQVRNLRSDAKVTLKNAVINVKNVLDEGYKRYKGKLTPLQYIDRIKNDLRAITNLSITDMDNDNHLFIIADDGTSILEPNRPQLEGTNLFENAQFGTMVRDYFKALEEEPSGVYVDGHVNVAGQPLTDAITFIVQDEELGIIIGTHIDQHDILNMTKQNLITGLKEIFSVYDKEMIVADIHTMEMVIHPNKNAEGQKITNFPELMESFKTIMKSLDSGEHYGKITCIKDYETLRLDQKTIYVKRFDDIGIILSTGFFESDYNALIEAKVADLKSNMFHDMLVAVIVIFIFGVLTITGSLLFKRKISSSFDTFALEIEEYQEELTHSLTTDSLTGLGNRSYLIEELDSRTDVALAIINIDDFSKINDFYGTAIGDKVILQIAEQLKKHFLSNHHRVYRLHADEFAILQLNTESVDTLHQRLKQLIEQIRSGVTTIDGLPVSIHPSAGLAAGENVLLNANIALKTARNSRLHCMVYDQAFDTSEQYKKNVYWTNKVKWAIENDRIIPYYQPIYNIKEMTINKYECLVRLLDENGDIILPASFLDAAHRSYLYPDITRIMLQKSIPFFAGTSKEFAINISISDIRNSETMHLLHMLIEEHQVHDQITLEIVESEELEHDDTVKYFFEQMHILGCKIAIDDFGTGYSNFSYLQSIKPDFIKIDGSLIKNIDTDFNAKSLVEVIVQYAKRNGIQTVAEFVSSQTILWDITSLGIDYAQGYYINTPQHQLAALSDAFIKNNNINTSTVTPTFGL